ncbi:MAG TPA: hypothetical protein VGD74_09750 [Vulgatibacter sp.]
MITLLRIILHPGPRPGEEAEFDRIDWEWGAWPPATEESEP